MQLTRELLGDNSISDLDGLSPEEFYEMKVQDILDSIHLVRGHITKARQLQDLLRSFEVLPIFGETHD